MTLTEFKAWFDGYTEDMDKPPTIKQWKRIKEQVAAITGTPISYPVYIDRYRPYVGPYWTAMGVGVSNATSTITLAGNAVGQAQSFNGIDAMYAAGKAEAQSMLS